MEIIDQIIQAFLSTSWLERFSVGCGIIQVLLSKNNKVSNYLFGILGIISGMYVLFGAKLYADIALNMYYLVMSVYGWWYWKTNKEASEQPITGCNKREWSIVASIVIVAFIVLYFSLISFTDSDVPVWDAWVSATAWAGMWLLARRKIENWILLNVSNAFAVPLLIHKDLYLFALMTTFLFIVAIFGYFKWAKIMKLEAKIS
ncbi:nicotinamide riboside transporter PnuC [Sphingobacterium bovisgrunnientis]|uniref:nicotinamide riboside transporter PnuC n=1 Tax=Sphingobacterium bovisgrunnientis TaxID=1874697 RepID=UPI00135BC167|nr:nicotinamide riboside transporter PnuC [Sphingobacterium bovisgrunnientis]